MSGLIGSLLLLLGVLAMTTAISASRRRHPPGWLIEGFGGEAISLATVTLLGFGAGYTLHFIATLGTQHLVTLQTAVLLATPLTCWGAWRLLASRQAFTALLDEEASVLPLPSQESTTPRRPEGHLKRIA